MASRTARAVRRLTPSFADRISSSKAPSGRRLISDTVASSFNSAPAASAASVIRTAYSGPVSSSLKYCTPNPL